jgi:hypothetical protein
LGNAGGGIKDVGHRSSGTADGANNGRSAEIGGRS